MAKTGSKEVEIAVGWRTTLQFHALNFLLTVSVPKKEKVIMRINFSFLGPNFQKEGVRAMESVVLSDIF